MIRWITVVVRWTARITGLLLVGLVVLMAIGEGDHQTSWNSPFPSRLNPPGCC